MAKERASLVMGKVLAVTESRLCRFEVRAGRWVTTDGKVVAECVVICQQRRKGEFAYGPPFRMVIEGSELGGILEGLSKWKRFLDSGTVGSLSASENGSLDASSLNASAA